MSNTSDLNRTVKEHASDLGRQAKAAATQEAVAHVENAKQTAASKVVQAADAAQAAASELDPASPQAQAMQQVADTIEGVASKLRHADVRQVASDVSAMARRNPMLFIGGAAIAGFAAARFLKTRDPQPSIYASEANPWGTYPNGNAPHISANNDHTTVMAKTDEER